MTNTMIVQKQTNYKKTILLASFISLLISSSAACSDKSQVLIDVKNENSKASSKVIATGKPFFPIGVYHVSWYYSSEQRINDLRNIAAAGFNTIHASIKSNDDLNYDYEKFLDEADKLGVKVISEFGVDRVTTVNKFKNKPAVLGWNIGDDAGSHGSASELLQVHNQVKAIDPQHLTYTSVAFDVNMSRLKQTYTNYAHVADIIGGQSYPIGLPLPINNVKDVYSIARSEATKYNRPVIANLQTFRWNHIAWSELGTENRRWPSAEEVRNMTYQALLAGVKGIIFYTYCDNENQLTTKPDVWKEMKNLALEIKKLSPILLNGKRRIIKTNAADLIAGTWSYQGRTYVLVINTSNSEMKPVSIQIPSTIVAEAKPMFSTHSSDMFAKDGRLSGSIKPLEVHVYRL